MIPLPCCVVCLPVFMYIALAHARIWSIRSGGAAGVPANEQLAVGDTEVLGGAR